ncbi:MAG TPA: hypothetical protein VFN51_02485 [Candidatus Saccharimonadales bacterium]|nr:hypothetical protein [Candidatus Saccharimonadales bacterium]
MEKEKNSEDFLSYLLFREVVEQVGAPVIRNLIEHSEQEVAAHHNGAFLVTDDLTVSAASEGVSFIYHGWGPVHLSMNGVNKVLGKAPPKE